MFGRKKLVIKFDKLILDLENLNIMNLILNQLMNVMMQKMLFLKVIFIN